MQITLILVLHVSISLAGNVVTTVKGQAQSYPTGLRDDEDFASPGSGSGAGPLPVEPAVQSSGSEPIESASKAPEIFTTRVKDDELLNNIVPSTMHVTPSSTSTTTATAPPRPPATKRSTTTTPTTPVPTTPSTTATTTQPLYEVFTGVNQYQQQTTVVKTTLDDSCLPVNYIPTYPWPVKIYCNRESNTLRAICVVGPPPQTCYCVDPLGGSILYDAIYPNCGPVTQARTTPVAPVQPSPQPTTTIKVKPSPKSTAIRLQPTTPRLTSSPRPPPPPTTTKPTTTTMESFKIDQETLDARAETTRSWDQGVPVIATFMGQPGLLAAIICGAVVGLLTAVLLVMFLVYRMRKKDEGSYVIEEPSKRVPLVQPYERTREYYA